MGEYLTIREAAIFSGKSEKTIRGLVRRLSKIDESGTLEGTRQVLKKEPTPQGYKWLISRSTLVTEYGLEEKSGTPEDTQQVSQEVPDELPTDTPEGTQIIPFLQEQIRKKDEQIGLLLERQREQNILLHNYQQRLLEAPDTQTDVPATSREARPPRRTDTLSNWWMIAVIGLLIVVAFLVLLLILIVVVLPH